MELVELRELVVLQVQMEHQEHQGLPVRMELQEQVVLQVLVEPRVLQGLVVLQELAELLDLVD